MTSFTNNGVQVAEFEYEYSADGGATGAIDLAAKAGAPEIPVDAIIEEVVTVVKTALAGGGAASASLGYTGSTAAYVANAAIASWSDEAIMTTAFSAKAIAGANHAAVLFTISGAALTAGNVKVLVKFLHHQA
jgi:hypothetical protein